jgi:hypothetical protein
VPVLCDTASESFVACLLSLWLLFGMNEKRLKLTPTIRRMKQDASSSIEITFLAHLFLDYNAS